MMKLALSFIFAVVVVAQNPEEQPCLVLTDNEEFSFPALKSALKANCPKITVKSIADKSITLNQFGVDLFSNLVIVIENGSSFKFPFVEDPSLLPESPAYRQGQGELVAAKYAELRRGGNEGISLFDVLKFVDAGKHNLIVSVQGGSGASGDLNLFLKEFGMTLKGADSVAVDYFSESAAVTSTALESEPWTQVICGPNPVEITGSPITLSSSNPNVFPILRASETAFHPSSATQGFGIVLGAVNQALNGARVTLVTSTQVLKNNKEFANSLVSWTFGQRGILRARDLYHHRSGEKTAPRMYKEKDEIEVGLKIEELKNGNWVPFSASDVQMEFVMLDPHIRKFLKFTGNEHKLVFTAPDVYGIFKFKVDYNRRGYNPIFIEQVAPVRNPWHNDYPRFLPCAYPYYASCFVTLGLVIIFAAAFVNHKETGKTTSKEARHRS